MSNKALTRKQEEWAYEQWCNGYTRQEIANALFVSTKVISRAFRGRPRIKKILEYDFSEENK